jgi:hypothetical protein
MGNRQMDEPASMSYYLLGATAPGQVERSGCVIQTLTGKSMRNVLAKSENDLGESGGICSVGGCKLPAS